MRRDSVILAPSCEDFAPKWNEHHSGSPVYQALWTLTGLPALSIPVQGREPLPASIQLIAPLFADAELLRFAQRLCTALRSEEHTSELQSLMRISSAFFCLKKKNTNT